MVSPKNDGEAKGWIGVAARKKNDDSSGLGVGLWVQVCIRRGFWIVMMFAAAGILFLVVGDVGDVEGVTALEKHLLERTRKLIERQDAGGAVYEGGSAWEQRQQQGSDSAAQDGLAAADTAVDSEDASQEVNPADAEKKEAVEKMLQDLQTKKEALETLLNDPETQKELQLHADEPPEKRLHGAAFDGHVKAVEALVAQAGADGGGALLADGGFNVDLWTPLHFAARGGQAGTAQALLRLAPNPAALLAAQNRAGSTPRQLAEETERDGRMTPEALSAFLAVLEEFSGS